ncbi:hypothetical protein B0H12DRAFT_1066940 [Mycena haematopus]|nr:hypothetical protein B0H12DRAFT_1066940 [Mycena haematopus]
MSNPQSLPPASQEDSPLQLSLNNVFASSAGSVSYPQDAFYQFADVKAYNQHILITPAAVTRPTTSEEISRILRCAVDSGVKVQARRLGGQDNAVVVDMVNFQQFTMNTSTWEATVGAGTLLGDLTRRLHDAGGRAIAHGTCPQVGIGGHATIGGLGPLSRQWGMALDHVLEVEIVLADGTITRASATQNPHIFFAVKGAAASFGIVTEFVFMTHPEPTNIIQYSYKIESRLGNHADMASTFHTWQSIIADPALDRKLASQVLPYYLATYFGTEEEYKALNFDKQLANDRHSATVLAVEVDDWVTASGLVLSTIGPKRGYCCSVEVSLTFKPENLIPEEGIQKLFEYFDNADKGTPLWFAIFDLAGGAVNDVSQHATAFAHRDALFYLQTYAIGIETLSETTIAFLTGLSNTITDSMPEAQFGAYPGYVDPLLKDGPLEYWGENLLRLQQVKAARDPDDLFHNPQSVPVA